jgi:NADP-dependent 3-hydroxy acid dehydrogenase YdfG
MNIKNQLIIVTGSSSGIGRACSELLLEKGNKVIGFRFKGLQHTS